MFGFCFVVICLLIVLIAFDTYIKGLVLVWVWLVTYVLFWLYWCTFVAFRCDFVFLLLVSALCFVFYCCLFVGCLVWLFLVLWCSLFYICGYCSVVLRCYGGFCGVVLLLLNFVVLLFTLCFCGCLVGIAVCIGDLLWECLVVLVCFLVLGA